MSHDTKFSHAVYVHYFLEQLKSSLFTLLQEAAIIQKIIHEYLAGPGLVLVQDVYNCIVSRL